MTRIDDVWTGAEGDKQPIATDVRGKLATWVGETWFEPIGSQPKPKVGGITIEPKYFVEVFAGKAGLSRAVVKFAMLKFTPSRLTTKTVVTFSAKPLRNTFLA